MSCKKGGRGNPISKEEVMRLQKYVEMARRNDVFSPDDAQDFYNLSELVTQERSDDEGAWSILMLATIILALQKKWKGPMFCYSKYDKDIFR